MVGHMRDCRQDQTQAMSAGPQRRYGLAEWADQSLDLTPARAWQQEKRLFAIRGQIARSRLFRRRREHARLTRQPVPHEGARRPAQTLKLGRLERQDAEDVVDIGFHRGRPARPPCPNAWTDVMD